MSSSITKLVPNITAQFQTEVLVVSIVIFIIADLTRLPLSFSMSLVGLLGGFALARGLTSQISYMTEVVATWFAAPIAAGLVAYFLLRYLNSRRVSDIYRRIRFYKVLLLVLAFTVAYTLGANTLGLIVATGGFNWATVSAAVAAIFIGTFLLGEGAIRRVGEEFYLMRYSNATIALAISAVLVEAASLLNIPLSNTQATAGAVLGTGLSYKSKFLSLKPFLIIVVGWIVAPLLSFVIGYLLLTA
jgi:PiT family inorganic phosphate transporter